MLPSLFKVGKHRNHASLRRHDPHQVRRVFLTAFRQTPSNGVKVLESADNCKERRAKTLGRKG
jgi:hypothetical protein